MALISTVLDEWQNYQSNLESLRKVLGRSDTIMKQLPSELVRFQKAEEQWCEVMENVRRNPNMLSAVLQEDRLDMFMQANRTLQVAAFTLSDCFLA